MDDSLHLPTAGARRPRGIQLRARCGASERRAADLVGRHGLDPHIRIDRTDEGLQLTLKDAVADDLAPNADTLGLAARLAAADLDREILVAMLAAPRPLDFPSVDELESALRIRRQVADAAARTQLAFDTEAVERPEDCWRYDEDSGFTVLPGVALIDALTKATQPGVGGRRYAFSCYRATEYVILLGLAHELADSNPALLARLQARWERKAIMSGAFHEAFLVEHGSIDAPLPERYYVPGDRVWFRNPDPVSADVAGYEGSWVIYLGGGLFSNFWEPGAPFTLERKCVEIYHWRHGVRADAAGEPTMDEALVAARVALTLSDPAQAGAIVERMWRLRDPRGVYASGGCIDASRESTRFVRPQTSDIRLDV